MKLFVMIALASTLLVSACAGKPEVKPETQTLTEEQKAEKKRQEAEKQRQAKEVALARLKAGANGTDAIAQDVARYTTATKEAADSADSPEDVRLVTSRIAATKASAEHLAAIAIDTHQAATNALKVISPKAEKGKKDSEEKKEAKPKNASDDDGQAAANGDKKNGKKGFWENFGFGVGLSLTAHLGSDDRVKSASLDANGLVRIDEEEDAIARVVLETHFFGDCRAFLGIKEKNLQGLLYPLSWLGAFAKNDGDCGIGPFVAVQSGDDEVIDAVGAGLMIGFKRTNASNSSSFNIGIGYIVDPNETVLGKGINEGQALPGDEADGETVRLRKKAQHGLLLLTSFAF